MERHVYTHATVEHPYRVIREIFERKPALLFDPDADAHQTMSVEGELEANVLHAHIERLIDVRFGNFRDGRDGVCYRHLAWSSSALPHLYPKMIGELEAAETGDDRVQISFIGAYRPPLQPLGEVGEAMGLNRVAEEAIRNLVERISRNLDRVCQASDRPSVGAHGSREKVGANR